MRGKLRVAMNELITCTSTLLNQKEYQHIKTALIASSSTQTTTLTESKDYLDNQQVKEAVSFESAREICTQF